jgi:hypothetical protein
VNRALVVVVALTAAAHAEAPAALRDVLGEAPTIVRGTASDTTRTGAFADTHVLVLETLRGEIDGDTVTVRQPSEGEEPLPRGEDFILLLDAKTPDGVYPLHHPAGRYRVEPGEPGDVVVINASGVDGAAISPKDLRPRAPDERIPLDSFRTYVGPAPKPPRNTPPDSLPVVTPRPGPAAPVASQPSPPAPAETPPEPGAMWPWLVGALVVVAVLMYLVRR